MKKRHVGLVVALCLVMIAAVALAAANQWGFKEFAARWGFISEETVNNAAELIQTDVLQKGGETDWCTFTVREAVADGNKAYLVVAVKPKREDLLLTGEWNDPEDPVSNVGELFDDIDMSIGDYAKSQGKTIVTVGLGEQGPGAEESVAAVQDGQSEADGTYVMMLSGPCTSERAKAGITLNCTVIPHNADGSYTDNEAWQETTLSFTLDSAETTGMVRSTQGADYPSVGVHVDSVTLTASATMTKVEICYTVTDAAAYGKTEDGLWFELLDENGERIRMGNGDVGSLDGSETAFIQTEEYTAMAELPASITLRAYECWEKQRFETCVLPME